MITFSIILFNCRKKWSLPGGLEPPTSRLTAVRANQLRHGSCERGEKKEGHVNEQSRNVENTKNDVFFIQFFLCKDPKIERVFEE